MQYELGVPTTTLEDHFFTPLASVLVGCVILAGVDIDLLMNWSKSRVQIMFVIKAIQT